MRIESASEDSFVRQNLITDTWLGADDSTTEGSWRWKVGNQTFFTGNASGSVTSGFYAHWAPGEPNNQLNEDCAGLHRPTGQWFDYPCILAKAYVCESTADLCPTSGPKTQPGTCGCGVPDVDSDGDGVPDCLDECPADVETDRRGTCGCPSDPEPAGTACADGYCGGQQVCDALGTCGNPQSCSPDTTCTYERRGQGEYYFCHDPVTQAVARQRCQAVGMDLAEVESIEENTFLHQHGHLLGIHWLGGEQTSQNEWTWPLTAEKFWESAIVNGKFTSWHATQPQFALGNCMLQDATAGQWAAANCSVTAGYICERSDRCPGDLEKTRPGACGCGRPDRDWNDDGQVDCSWLGGFDDDPNLDPSIIAVGSQPQLDTTICAIKFMEGDLSLGDYLAVATDRTDKRELIFNQEGYAEELEKGDQDGDLVPDSMDECPHTPALTPTDEVGCTDPTRMDGLPDDQTIREFVEGMQLGRAHPSNNCENSEPQTPELVSGYINNSQITSLEFNAFFVFKEMSCPVRLRVEAITEDPDGWAHGSFGQLLYFETGTADFTPAYSGGQVVQGVKTVIMTSGTFGDAFQNLWDQVPDMFGYDKDGPTTYRARMRVMGVYGNGRQSNWSNWVPLRVFGTRSL